MKILTTKQMCDKLNNLQAKMPNDAAFFALYAKIEDLGPGGNGECAVRFKGTAAEVSYLLFRAMQDDAALATAVRYAVGKL